MKKIVVLVISILLIFTTCFNKSYADGIDVINHILERSENNDNEAVNKIYNILNRNQENHVTILNTKIVDNKQQVKSKKITNKKILKGIDVSKWDGEINWKKVKESGVDFAIIRAGYGQTNADPTFKKNIEGAYKNNIIVGVYWFSYAYTNEQAHAEAKKCMETIKQYKNIILLPVFFDFEYDSMDYANSNKVRLNKEDVSRLTNIFCSDMQKYGYKSGIYTNLDYANRYFNDKILSEYDVWIAQWTTRCTYKNKYIIWQYSAKGRVPGISTFVDMNYYYNR